MLRILSDQFDKFLLANCIGHMMQYATVLQDKVRSCKLDAAMAVENKSQSATFFRERSRHLI